MKAVARRTWHYHQEEQRAADEERIKRQERDRLNLQNQSRSGLGSESRRRSRSAVLQQTQVQSSSSSHVAGPSNNSTSEYTFSSHYEEQEGSSDFGIFDDYEPPAPAFSTVENSASAFNGISSPEESEDEDNEEFGDGVEPEAILDATRQAFGEDDIDEVRIPSEAIAASSASASVSEGPLVPEPSYDEVTRSFLILVLALSAFYGVSREAAGLLLIFFAVVVFPLLSGARDQPPKQLSTVCASMDWAHYAGERPTPALSGPSTAIGSQQPPGSNATISGPSASTAPAPRRPQCLRLGVPLPEYQAPAATPPP
ncbi:hypothetical protein A4X06_0g7892 [Tilletia controversa]|uniref:Uncharacterized protein n=1 Tax=Tilletia controversa TaxID=13291 RepID=A0A8X7STP0_9BASI|nr:hypothetical protein CF336_g7584 [Tilletia laevis]KAE8240146.1 hypothetical protein A4X06_0g7892 [Tilletia controversa]